MINNFFVDDYYEVQTDRPEFKTYRVRLDNNWYNLCYEGNNLREVYFNLSPTNQTYVFSCRTDMKTVSHYYVHGNSVKRYENGECNRSYTIVNKEVIVCKTDNLTRIYRIRYVRVPVDETKLYNDLVAFLDEFSRLGLNKLYSPQEPLRDLTPKS